MTTYLNCMIAFENNGFTGDLDEVLTGWQAEIYRRMINKAQQTNQCYSVIQNLLEQRKQITGE